MRAWQVLVLALGCATALGCRTIPATQVLVFFHADDETAAAASSIRVRVTSDGATVVDRVDPLMRPIVGHLARVPLVPAGGDVTRRFRIEGALLDEAGTVLVEVSAVAGYVDHERRELHLWLDAECVGTESCGAGRTCQLGVCVGDCFATGEAERASALCGECEVCTSGACAPREDGAACGCEGDVCEAGTCSTAVPVRSVFASELHTCAIAGDDRVYCWGSDRAGQTSIGEETDVPTLVASGLYSGGSCGTDFTCLVGVFGERRCWGWNGGGEIGDGTIVEAPVGARDIEEPALNQVDSGWNHTCAIGEDAQVYCWGVNRNGELGADDIGGAVPSPRVLASDRFLQIATGGFHDCALRDDRRILCWGLNESGEVGTGDFDDRSEPTEVGCVEGRCYDDWLMVAAGDFFTCAIRAGGELWCWGGGQHGQLGSGPMSRVDVASPVGPIAGGPYAIVAGGGSHACAVSESGELSCWGKNDLGQVGIGGTEQIDRPVVLSVPGRAGFRGLGLGREHSCAVRRDETLWCWGRNEVGQLGLGLAGGGADRVSRPRRVCFPPVE